MAEEQHKGNWWIWKVFWILLGLTAFEVGLYWHFVDLVWVFVFTFFYLV